MQDHPLTRRTLLMGAAAAGLVAAGCGTGPGDSSGPSPAATTGAAPGAGGSSSASSTPSSASPSATPTPTPEPPDPAKIKANELGVVPVMMYHRLTDTPGEYDMSPDAFRAQMRRLLKSGYRPVDARDLARGSIDVPAGTTPVVLTFDDGSPNQFKLTSGGKIDPNCSAGIILSECAKVEGAKPRATFYVNKAPFELTDAGDQKRAMAALLDAGFQLGNHTLDHANLATLSDAGVEEEFVKLQQLVAKVAPEAKLDTMALPFGVAPRPYKLAKSGSWNGTAYKFVITLLVGANPSPSPFDAEFDPFAVPRIRGTSYQGGNTPLTGKYWLDYLDDHPEERYVSAGNPDHVTVPKKLKNKVADSYADRVITY